MSSFNIAETLQTYLVGFGLRFGAASISVRDVVLVVPDFDFAPYIFVEGLWACDDEICSELGCGQTGTAFYSRHFAFYGSDAGEVD